MSGDVIGLEDGYGSGLYVKQPLVLTRGAGARLWDVDGNTYIDCVGGHGVANVGHANPAVVEAVARQAGRLMTAPNGFYNDQRARLLALLVRIAPAGLERAYLCNSGAEAVEAAFKFARLATGRAKIVSTMRGFHGRTMGALSATWHKAYREPFEPLVPGFQFVPYGRLERMAQAVDEQTAAVVLEVVQGEGGVNPGDGDYLRGVQALCRERGALLIVDEVQTGFGRTGKMFACEHYGLEPDLMCEAKAMAGGVPMGAVLLGVRVGDLPTKIHIRRQPAVLRRGTGSHRVHPVPGSAAARGEIGRAADDRSAGYRVSADPRGARPGADGGGAVEGPRRAQSGGPGVAGGRGGGAGADGGFDSDAFPAPVGDQRGGVDTVVRRVADVLTAEGSSS
jgi:acetylornithine/LysW-gamma-L-lysine aminotransferase